MISETKYTPYTPLDFSEIDRHAKRLAETIRQRTGKLTDVLLNYESHEVAQDEIARTLDLLENLRENQEYFQLRVGAVAAFLPRNQPLYALTCFVLVPSLMAQKVHFRIPHSMRNFFPELLTVLDISTLFPNVTVSSKTRLEFLRDQSALLVNPSTGEDRPITDAVIFTGNPVHADQLRGVFDKRTLFITNGAGHNPVVVGTDADLSEAAEAVLTLQFYNQGQDCAAPNSILVQKELLANFLPLLRDRVRATTIGRYRDTFCRIGPISDPEDLVRIQDFLVQHREWLDPSTAGVIRAADSVVEPTIICKPLAQGGNFGEIFAPIIFVQEYTDDAELHQYFEDPHYEQNAMYVTLYGKSAYVESLIDRPIRGKVLHDRSSFLHNTHLHAPGMERGTQPYGGRGHGASSISINGTLISKATLPQRDIYEQIAKPILGKEVEQYRSEFEQFTQTRTRDVEKLLRLRSRKESPHDPAVHRSPWAYVDSQLLAATDLRYVKIPEEDIHHLLLQPNTEYGLALSPKGRTSILALQSLLRKKSSLSFDAFDAALYAVPREVGMPDLDLKASQRTFFQDVYQLLFGKTSGPRLALFLWEADENEVSKLLQAW